MGGQGIAQGGVVGEGDHPGRERGREPGGGRGAGLAGSGGAFVAGDGVVDQIDARRVAQGDPPGGQAGLIVDDDVVGDVDGAPGAGGGGAGQEILAADGRQRDAAAIAAGLVGLEQVAGDLDRSRTRAGKPGDGGGRAGN